MPRLPIDSRIREMDVFQQVKRRLEKLPLNPIMEEAMADWDADIRRRLRDPAAPPAAPRTRPRG